MNRKDAGFTLIEALIVLVIVSITVTIALPGFSSAVESTRTTATLHQLSADMAMARHLALKSQAQVVVCPRADPERCAADGDWRRGWLVFIDEDGDRQPDAHAGPVRQTDFPAASDPGFSLRSTRPFLRYQRDGRSAHSNLTVRVCSDGNLSGSVIVNNVGRVRTERPKRRTPCPAA